MVIEHSFVTVMEFDETLLRAVNYLAARGFTETASQKYLVANGTPPYVRLKRGVANAAKAKDVQSLPQTAHVEFDRGRVNVAISIEPSVKWGGRGSFAFVGPDGVAKQMSIHKEMTVAIMRGLQNALAHDGTGEFDYRAWDDAELQATRAAKRKQFRTRGTLLLLFGVLGVFAVLGFILGSRH